MKSNDLAFRLQRRLKRTLWLMQPRRLMGQLVGPRVLVISEPKAGTNMLRHTLNLFPQLQNRGTLVHYTMAEQLRRIADLRHGWVVSTHGHDMDWQVLDSILDDHDIKVLFVMRDLRDVCVSLCHYIAKEPSLPHHLFYRSLPDDHARLLVTITGYEGPGPDGLPIHVEAIGVGLRRRLRWLNHPRSCTVTFEELVGPRGGGDREQQEAAIRRIARHLDLALSARDVAHIAGSTFSTQTPTFRRGQIGSWREEFSTQHKSAFKAVAGQLLIDLGYERDLDW